MGMDQEAIQKLAAEIVRNMPNYPLWLLAIQVALTLVAAAAGAFLGEYFKTRGRNFATKADFEILLEQLHKNTQLVETIKSEVAQRDWVLREWVTLRRVKLEELIAKNADCDAYLDRVRENAIDGERFSEVRPDADMHTLMILYFPELKDEVEERCRCFVQQLMVGSRVAYDVLQLKQNSPFDSAKYATIHGKYLDELKPLRAQSFTADRRLKEAAAKLVQQIVGIA
jgi:hypothetical protein